VFHAVVSRKLGPPLYAEFSILYALMIALSMPVNILSAAITRVSVIGRTTGIDFDRIKRFSIKLGLVLTLIIGLGLLLLSPLIQKFLKTENLFLFLPLGLTLFIWGLTGVLRGLYTSIEAFGVLSYTAIVELFVRAVCGITFVLLGFKVFGALAGSIFGALSVFILLFNRRGYVEKEYNVRKQDGIVVDNFGGITSKVFFIALPTGFLLQLDLLLAKRFFSSEEAGIYAASALIGKGLLMFSTVASTVVYPKLVEEKLSKKGITSFLWGVAITILLFASGYVFLILFGKPVVGLLFGDKYTGVIGLVPLYTLSLIPLALYLQVTNYKGAVGGWIEGVWLWIVLGGYYLSLEIFSHTMHSYLQAIFFYHLIITPLSFIILYLRHKDKKGQRILGKKANAFEIIPPAIIRS